MKASLEHLSAEQIIDGINKCIDNTKSLFIDGSILYDNKRFERAYTLYQLSMEELGKSKLLFVLLLDIKLNKPVDWDTASWEFTRHEPKSKGAITFEEIAILTIAYEIKKGNIKGDLDELREYFLELAGESDSVAKQNNLNKQASLYVDITSSGFVSPSDVITENMTTELRDKLRFRMRAAEKTLSWFLPDIDSIAVMLLAAEKEPDYLQKRHEAAAETFRIENEMK